MGDANGSAPPVRDIREASVNSYTKGTSSKKPRARAFDSSDGLTTIRSLGSTSTGCIANGPMRCHPASGVGPLTLHVKRPHVATLPDGRAVNLPAGTVLREGEDDAAKQRRSYEFAALEAAAKYVTCGVMGTASEHEDAETKELRRAVGDLLAFNLPSLTPRDADEEEASR